VLGGLAEAEGSERDRHDHHQVRGEQEPRGGGVLVVEAEPEVQPPQSDEESEARQAGGHLRPAPGDLGEGADQLEHRLAEHDDDEQGEALAEVGAVEVPRLEDRCRASAAFGAPTSPLCISSISSGRAWTIIAEASVIATPSAHRASL
jgi:hypothetical protein